MANNSQWSSEMTCFINPMIPHCFHTVAQTWTSGFCSLAAAVACASIDVRGDQPIGSMRSSTYRACGRSRRRPKQHMQPDLRYAMYVWTWPWYRVGLWVKVGERTPWLDSITKQFWTADHLDTPIASTSVAIGSWFSGCTLRNAIEMDGVDKIVLMEGPHRIKSSGRGPVVLLLCWRA